MGIFHLPHAGRCTSCGTNPVILTAGLCARCAVVAEAERITREAA